MHREDERDAGEAVRRVLRALAVKRHLETGEWMPALAQDVDDVHRHAAGDAERQCLHGRGARLAAPIERHRLGAARRREPEFTGPRQRRGNGRLRHGQE